MTPIPFCSFGGYRRFCGAWWKDLWRYAIHGWGYDIFTYWRRARYGWAPRDTWSLDTYLEGLLGGALFHLATHTHSTPIDYPNNQWRADLTRWATAFADNARDDLHEKFGEDFNAWNIEEQRRRTAMQQALHEMLPWWENLWD